MTKKNPTFVESGIVLVNKPVGVSSNKVVNIVKFALDAKKCGHLGTLDLEGEGLLPVTVNNATKLFDFFLNKDKTYQTTFIFGFETDTLDTAGEVIKTKDCDIQTEQVERAIKTMIGKQKQLPPMYSAKKVGGKIAYKEARKGNTLDLKPKEIEIYDFKLLEKVKKNVFRFEISCSSGTYIRSVCRDLAVKLSTYGSMQCILRTRCGGFKIENSYTLEEIKNGKFALISCENVFNYDKIQLKESDVSKLLNGQQLKTSLPNGDYKIYGEKFVGVGKVESDILKLTMRF